MFFATCIYSDLSAIVAFVSSNIIDLLFFNKSSASLIILLDVFSISPDKITYFSLLENMLLINVLLPEPGYPTVIIISVLEDSIILFVKWVLNNEKIF